MFIIMQKFKDISAMPLSPTHKEIDIVIYTQKNFTTVIAVKQGIL